MATIVTSESWSGPAGGRRVYLSGPMTGIPDYNRPAFAAAAETLRAEGDRVFNPGTEHTDLPDGATSHRDYMARDLPVVMASDLVVVLPGWRDSAGARLEVHTALVCGIPVQDFATGDSITTLASEPMTVATGEVRITDPTTGGQKGSKPARLDLIPPDALVAVSRVFAFGATKYRDHNWALGYLWSLSYAALMRHLLAWWGGEDTDPESGEPHIAHVAWHALVLTSYTLRAAGTDDRPHVVIAQMQAEREAT